MNGLHPDHFRPALAGPGSANPAPPNLLKGAAIAGTVALGASGVGYLLAGLYVLGRFWRVLAAAFVLALIVVAIDPGAAPHDINRPVTGPPWPTWARQDCNADQGVQNLTLTNTTGPVSLYTISCLDGATFTVGH